MSAERDAEEQTLVGLYDAQPKKAKSIQALCKKLNLPPHRVYYVLKKHGRLETSPPEVGSRSKVISEYHALFGQHVQSYRYDQSGLGVYSEISAKQVADDLGWSLKKYRRLEMGTSESTLKDIQQIATYWGVSISSMFAAVDDFIEKEQKETK